MNKMKHLSALAITCLTTTAYAACPDLASDQAALQSAKTAATVANQNYKSATTADQQADTEVKQNAKLEQNAVSELNAATKKLNTAQKALTNDRTTLKAQSTVGNDQVALTNANTADAQAWAVYYNAVWIKNNNYCFGPPNPPCDQQAAQYDTNIANDQAAAQQADAVVTAATTTLKNDQATVNNTKASLAVTSLTTNIANITSRKTSADSSLANAKSNKTTADQNVATTLAAKKLAAQAVTTAQTAVTACSKQKQ